MTLTRSVCPAPRLTGQRSAASRLRLRPHPHRHAGGLRRTPRSAAAPRAGRARRRIKGDILYQSPSRIEAYVNTPGWYTATYLAAHVAFDRGGDIGAMLGRMRSEADRIAHENTATAYDGTSNPDRTRKSNQLWVLFDGPRSEVCRTFPGYAEDVIVTIDSRTLVEMAPRAHLMGRRAPRGPGRGLRGPPLRPSVADLEPPQRMGAHGRRPADAEPWGRPAVSPAIKRRRDGLGPPNRLAVRPAW